MGHVELDEHDQVVFVFPEYPDTDGVPRRLNFAAVAAASPLDGVSVCMSDSGAPVFTFDRDEAGTKRIDFSSKLKTSIPDREEKHQGVIPEVEIGDVCDTWLGGEPSSPTDRRL